MRYQYVLNEISIPNGYSLNTKLGTAKERMLTKRKIRKTWNQNYFETELHKIISTKRPIRYEVLPGKEGIKQLLKSGKIKRLPGEGAAEVFEVNEEIPHYPVGLVHHRYVFVFDSDTSQPEFNPGYKIRIR